MSFPDSFPGSQWMPVPNADVFSSNSHAAIVIHKTAGFSTPQQVANFFITSSPGPSVHYIVGLDGSVVQCVSESSGAGGNCCLEAGHDPFWDAYNATYGNLNLCTLSIEHVDPATDNSTPCPPAQLATSFALVLYLSQKYNIPVSHIKPHSSLDPISRARCPGNYPFSDLLTYVQNGGNSTPQPTTPKTFPVNTVAMGSLKMCSIAGGGTVLNQPHNLGYKPGLIFVQYAGDFGTPPTKPAYYYGENDKTINIVGEAGYSWIAWLG